MISWRNLTEKARVINNIVNTIDRKIAIIDLFIFKEIFFPLNSRMWHDRPSSCPAPLSKHTGKEFNFRSMPKIWEASQQIIIITILMYAEIIVCTINQLFIYSSRSTGISYGSCEKGPLDCEDARSNISKTSEGYLKVFVVSTSADARSNAVYNNQKQIGIYKTQMRWLIYIFTSRF